jgi:hypothetical protein
MATKCRSPPGTGLPADPASQAAARKQRGFGLLNARISASPVQGDGYHLSGALLTILGVILLIIGFIAKIAIVWTLGIIVVVVGAILAVLGMAGHAVRGRKHYF